MPSEHETKRVKQKLLEEIKLYFFVFAFLALMFSAFLTFRRLISNEAGITYLHYGSGIIKAAIVAKIIMIGQALKLGKNVENQPLMIAVLVKAALFGLLVAIFNVIERVIEELIRGNDWPGISNLLVMNGLNQALADALILMVSFIPFFAFWETGRVLGEGTLSQMFFGKRM